MKNSTLSAEPFRIHERYTQLPNSTLEYIMQHGDSTVERCIAWLYRFSFGWGSMYVVLSDGRAAQQKDCALASGLSTPSTCRAFARMRELDLLRNASANGEDRIYPVHAPKPKVAVAGEDPEGIHEHVPVIEWAEGVLQFRNPQRYAQFKAKETAMLEAEKARRLVRTEYLNELRALCELQTCGIADVCNSVADTCGIEKTPDLITEKQLLKKGEWEGTPPPQTALVSNSDEAEKRDAYALFRATMQKAGKPINQHQHAECWPVFREFPLSVCQRIAMDAEIRCDQEWLPEKNKAFVPTPIKYLRAQKWNTEPVARVATPSQRKEAERQEMERSLMERAMAGGRRP